MGFSYPTFCLEEDGKDISFADRALLESLIGNLLDDISRTTIQPMSPIYVALGYRDNDTRPVVRMRLKGSYTALVPASAKSVEEDHKQGKISFKFQETKYEIEKV